MKIEKLSGVSSKTGKPRKGIKAFMHEAEYESGCENSCGLCLLCGAVDEGVEPDARGYECHSCERRGVYGFEEAFMLGRIVLR